MNITQNIISRGEAVKISPDYVAYVEGDFDKWRSLDPIFQSLKRGQRVLAFTAGVFVLAKVTKVDHDDFRAVDGPIVRVANDEYSWRVDGDNWAVPVSN